MTIDWWTLGIQTVNVVILIWLLTRFFWRPVAAIIEQRRAAAAQMLAEAELKRSQAADALAAIEQTRTGFDQERDAIITAAHAAAEHERAALLAAAAQESTTLQTSAKAAIEKARNAEEKAWAERAGRLAINIAERLVAPLAGPAVSDAFLAGLLQEIRELPASVRDAITGDDIGLEVVSATPIQPAEQERYRHLISEAFGTSPQITFKADATLIAGLELNGPHLVIHNSWRADLSKILADLTHDTLS